MDSTDTKEERKRKYESEKEMEIEERERERKERREEREREREKERKERRELERKYEKESEKEIQEIKKREKERKEKREREEREREKERKEKEKEIKEKEEFAKMMREKAQKMVFENQPNSLFLSLSDDVLFQICQKLHPFELVVLSSTCRRLWKLIHQDKIWKPLSIKQWNELEHATSVEDWYYLYQRKKREQSTSYADLMSDPEFRGCEWYTCPAGHPYMIGECRLPMMMSKCPTCGEKIGGKHHSMLTRNQRLGPVASHSHLHQKLSSQDISSVSVGSLGELSSLERGAGFGVRRIDE